MNEASIKAKIVAHLKKEIPMACVLRHEDAFTAGIPDISINFRGTYWLEVKYLRAGETQSKMREHFDLLQLATCRWLEAQAHCDYFLAYHLGKVLHSVIVSPLDLSVWLESKVLDVGNFQRCARAIGVLSTTLDQLTYNLKQRRKL